MPASLHHRKDTFTVLSKRRVQGFQSRVLQPATPVWVCTCSTPGSFSKCWQRTTLRHHRTLAGHGISLSLFYTQRYIRVLNYYSLTEPSQSDEFTESLMRESFISERGEVERKEAPWCRPPHLLWQWSWLAACLKLNLESCDLRVSKHCTL